jgi:hypothetical protein
MKSKDVQNIVLSKCKNDQPPMKIFRDLNGAVSYRTVRRWCKMIQETGTISLNYSTDCPRLVRTKQAIKKAKNRFKGHKTISARKLAFALNCSRSSASRIIKDDLKLKSYKMILEPLLTDEHKEKRQIFANWVRNHFRKEDTMRFLFSDEKMIDMNGIYNSQNDRVWAIDREDAEKKCRVKPQRKFPQKVMVWLGVCSKGVSPIVIFEKGTLDHDRYIRDVLPVALRYGNQVFGSQWMFQQDGAMPHAHRETQEWCANNFPAFIDKDHWPPNSPDLNPLDYCIWDELARAIKWNKITSKKTLIGQIKLAAKKIRPEVVLESCTSWTNRLYQMSQNSGAYLRD